MSYLNKTQKKEKIVKIIKLTLGAFIAILIAGFLGLKNYMTAGIIGILSLQTTKLDTLQIAGQRFVSLILAFAVAFISFKSLGYTIVGFGVFLLIFISISVFTNMTDSISICVVLISQIAVAKTMSGDFIVNQSLIFIIGASIGILLNLYVPTKPEDIYETQNHLDNQIKNILFTISKVLIHDKSTEDAKKNLENVKTITEEAILKAEELDENFLLSDYSYYPKYLIFRRSQLSFLNEFVEYNYKPDVVSEEEIIISNFVKKIGEKFHECNDASELLLESEKILNNFKKSELPKTREEFETRAILYGQLIHITAFLKLKRSFINTLTSKQLEHYYKQCELPK